MFNWTEWHVDRYYYVDSIQNVSPLIEYILRFYIHLFVRLIYHSTITLLIIDRFLVFHLNMRYLILWPYERLLKSLKVIYLVSFLPYIFLCACLFSSQLTGIIFSTFCSLDISFGMLYILWTILKKVRHFNVWEVLLGWDFDYYENNWKHF